MLANLCVVSEYSTMKSHSEFFDESLKGLRTLLKQAPTCDDIIVQCRNIVSLYNRLELEENYRPYFVLIALDSDTDHLPKGSVRKLWNTEALNKKDQESKEIEQFYRKDFLKSCEAILLNLQKSKT